MAGINSNNYGPTGDEKDLARQKLIQDALLNMGDTQSKEKMQKSAQDSALAQLIKGHQLSQEGDLAKITAGHNADTATRNEIVGQGQDILSKLRAQNPGNKYNIGLSKEGMTLAETPPGEGSDLRKEAMVQSGMKDVSKRYEKLNGFNSALDEMDSKTNRDGKGGILTNPDAKVMSAGTIASAMPTSAVGIGELVGMMPKGSSDERKAAERLKLEYQKAMSGMRVTDQARQQEGQAMGWMASGDPNLVAKGIRALARNVKGAYGTIQQGYTPEVLNRVHAGGEGNPLDRYSNMVQDGPAGMPPKPMTPPQGAPMSAAPQAPMGTAPAPAATQKQIKQVLQNKTTGQKKIIYDDGSSEIQ